MSEEETAVRLGGVRRSKEQTLGVMFFGTLEISWMAPGETLAWGEGLRRQLYHKAKTRRAFVAAVQMVMISLEPLTAVSPAPNVWDAVPQDTQYVLHV